MSGEDTMSWTLALSQTAAGRLANGPYVQLAVVMCAECCALVPEDLAPRHEAFHARAEEGRA